MHDSMFKKLDQLENRINEIQDLLLDSETVKDIEKYTLLNKEFSDLKPIVDKFNEYNQITKSIEDANEIINSGERTYAEWTKRQQSISYLFKEESNKLLEENQLQELFECGKGHPLILKRFLGGDISLETFVIFDIIFSFSEKFDEKLLDPVWETVSMKIRKYKPFLSINVSNFKKILRELVDV